METASSSLQSGSYEIRYYTHKLHLDSLRGYGRSGYELQQKQTMPSLINFGPLLSELKEVNCQSGAVGHVHRQPGLRGAVLYGIKRVLRRLLTWYTQPLHEYQAHVTRTLNETAVALQILEHSMMELSKKHDEGLQALAQNVDAAFRVVHEAQAFELPQQLRLAERYVRRLQRLVAGGQDAETSILGASAVQPSPPAILPPVVRSLPFGVNLVGHLQSEKGVGEAARASSRSLQAARIPLAVSDFADSGSLNIEEISAHGSDGNPYRFNVIHMNAAELGFFAAQSKAFLKDRYNIGFWNWELSSFPWEWYGKFRHLNEIWVPSQFTRESVAGVAPVPVCTIPYSIDPKIAEKPTWNRSHFGMQEGVFTFLFVFDLQSYVERKNPRALIRAFSEAFSDSKDALLLIKCSHIDHAPSEFASLQTSARGLNIQFLTDILTRQSLNALFHLSDAYVSLHRAEGFGLTLAEAMALAKPVIATDYSANTDFMRKENSFPVRYKLVEIKSDHGVYHQGFEWAEPDIDHAAEQMRYVFHNQTKTKMIAEEGRKNIWSQFHPAVVGGQMRDRLNQLADRG